MARCAGGSAQVEHKQQGVVDGTHLIERQVADSLAEGASVDCTDQSLTWT